jgi:hypothetical protein
MCHRVNCGPKKPPGIARPVNERKPTVTEFPRQDDREFVYRKINHCDDARRMKLLDVVGVANVTEPERVARYPAHQ